MLQFSVSVSILVLIASTTLTAGWSRRSLRQPNTTRTSMRYRVCSLELRSIKRNSDATAVV